MTDPAGCGNALVSRTIAAHRAYLRALLEWERLIDSTPEISDPEVRLACARAEVHKETCRRVFRDLIDELGFLPSFDHTDL